MLRCVLSFALVRLPNVLWSKQQSATVCCIFLQMPEEEAFAVLVKMMYTYNLRELFKPSMAELGLRMFQLESMIQVFLQLLFYSPILHET